MRKIYYLKSCSTCKRIITELNLVNKNFKFQDIKVEKITPQQLQEMKELAGSYEALFSRSAMKYKELKLSEKHLDEEHYKNYILEEYTFLKRPVIILDSTIYIGNSAKIIELVKSKL